MHVEEEYSRGERKDAMGSGKGAARVDDKSEHSLLNQMKKANAGHPVRRRKRFRAHSEAENEIILRNRVQQMISTGLKFEGARTGEQNKEVAPVVAYRGCG
eukprot:TRINITY_DN2244_c0_g1_i1.p1 TRINITY_DN2244_c0_g1~~TRINITY_DN2244_c0_g1_i1.p1  ORF type:complete len:101 (+),score=7.06 TRINITY_DN2244_c0_g1_i1:334-636(+)